MQKLEIDYSELPSSTPQVEPSDWEAPVHKYFGRKLPNGKTEKEPVYQYQEFPRLMYALQNNKIVARIVHNQEAKNALGSGWEPTPAAFGFIGAPSFEQHLEIQRALDADKIERAEAAEALVDAVKAIPKRMGRPPKVE